jgi:4-coumarate--CoA ligase
VSTQNDVLLKNAAERSAFEKKIQKWIKSKVAGHKQLRGGVLVIAAIPKSAAGKILRKDLRALAAKEGVQAKL